MSNKLKHCLKINTSIVAKLALVLLMTNCGGKNAENNNDTTDSLAVETEETVEYLEGGKAVIGKIGTATQSIAVNGTSFRMIPVEGGTFTMGATSEQGGDVYDDEHPTHEVTLSDYYIAETEVSQGLWKAVMGNNPSLIKSNNSPVENVSWDNCQEFIQKLNQLTGKKFRLPTEAEWEYAARGGNKSNGYKYAGSNKAGDVAWYFSNKTHQVAGKMPNELGVYDMSGNVYEWCQDRYGDYCEKSQTNPQGVSKGSSRTLRGGSWIGDMGSCRVAYRSHRLPTHTENNLGLRLVMDVE